MAHFPANRCRLPYKESETIENEITLDGKVSPKYKIIWYDKFRTGTADVPADEKLRNLHFEFREGWDLEIVELNDSPINLAGISSNRTARLA